MTASAVTLGRSCKRWAAIADLVSRSAIDPTLSSLNVVRFEFTKWDGRLHWHCEVDVLGEDEHGLWLGVPEGRLLQRGDEEPVPCMGLVCLVPAQGRWIANFYAFGDNRGTVYIDVTDEPKVDGDVVRAIDLDLDVIRFPDGRVILDDEDEFREHCTLFGYPDDTIAACEATARELLAAVTNHDEPFGTASDRWKALLGS